MSRRVTIDVEARFVDNVSDESQAATKSVEGLGKEADKTKKKVDDLGKKKASPIFDADNNKFLNKIRTMEAKMTKFGHTKTAAVLGFVDKGTVVIGKLLNKAQNFASKTWQGLLSFKDSNALATIKKITNAAEGLTKKAWTALVKVKDMALAPIKAIKNALFSIPTLITAIVSAKIVQKAVLEPINLADAYSSAKIGFSTLLGESAGQEMMNQIDLFAKKTPFKTSGVISNAQKMMAYGWDVDRVIDDMETIGDAAAATGKGDAGLESIVRALAEIRSKGRLSTQELNQLAGAGIKAKGYLAEGLGYGTSDEGMMKLAADLEKGAIGANQAIDLILQGMQEFDGMMDKTANETVEGLKSQIEDAFEINIFRRWGQGLQDGAKKGFGSLVTLLDEADEALGKVGDMLQEIGSNISTWVADKFQNAVDRIMSITDSFEFRNASLGEKVSMLWNGVIVDPLKEWWEGGGQEKTAKTAGKIGKWLGESITKGLLAVLGVTDIFDDNGMGESGGYSVAQSFAKGFTDGFDASAITDKLVDAIKNVWNALPWWGKTLIGGYIGGKAAIGLGDLVGGIGNIVDVAGNVIGGAKGILGSTGNSIVSGSGVLGKLADVGYTLAGGPAAAAGMGGTTAALVGGGSVLGGATAVFGLNHAIGTGIDAYKDFKSGDKRGGWANVARSASTASGIGLGAAAGAKLGAVIGTAGGPIGTVAGGLIGAGLGTVVGWFAGDKIAKNIEAAKYESEELSAAIKDGEKSAEEMEEIFARAKWENAKEHFGDISLSMDEIARLANQIVWGDDLQYFEQFSSATKTAEANLQSLKQASQDIDKWMWKAGLGIKFNDDEKEAFAASFDDYITAAKSFIENKHYEFSTSASLLVDVESEKGKSIIDSGNAYYGKLTEEINSLGSKLSDKVNIALEDGVITLDEQKEITNLQEQIANITSKLADAEAAADIELIKVKWGGGNLDIDSFDKFMSTMSTTIEERVNAADEAFKVQVSNLNLQLADGSITQEEYNEKLNTLISGYEAKIEGIRADIVGVELGIVGDAYKDVLGDDAANDLSKALDEALKTGIDPVEWTDAELAKLLGVDKLEGETAANIKEMLSGVFSHMELLDVEAVDMVVGVNIKGEKHIEDKIEVYAHEFGIPEDKAAIVSLLLNGDKEIVKQIDTTKLAEEMGVPVEVAEKVIAKITGEKEITNRFGVVASDFGIKSTYTFQPSVKIEPKYMVIKGSVNLGNPKMSYSSKQAQLMGGEYRGGIVGGTSAMEAFALGGRPDDGMLKGSTRFIRVNEESPEMIIPLSSQRRGRALKLWAQAGNIMGVPGFARGGLTSGGADEGFRFGNYDGGGSAGGQSVEVDIGGITFEIHVNGNDPQSITEAIKAQANEIADTVAGVLADALGAQFENTPARGGVA